jgi:acyl-CoA-binding protein
VKAISAIKTLSSSKSGRGLSRPPAEARASLYGLYKQATEGNVGGLMPRPTGNTPEIEANKRKWDAWKAQEGLTSKQAKKNYTALLIDTMKTHATGSDEAKALLDDLQTHYDQIKDLDDTRSVYSASTFDHGRELPAFYGRGQAQIGPAFDDSVNDRLDRSWRRDVTWTLETISEEIHAMRERYLRGAESNALPDPSISPVSITQNTPLRGLSTKRSGMTIGSNSTPTPNGTGGSPSSPWWLQLLLAFSRWAQKVTQRFVLDFAALAFILALVRYLKHRRVLMKVPVLKLILDFIDSGYKTVGNTMKG